MQRFALMRHAQLMEDAGRDQFIMASHARAELESWLDENAKDTDYFKRGDYYITAATVHA